MLLQNKKKKHNRFRYIKLNVVKCINWIVNLIWTNVFFSKSVGKITPIYNKEDGDEEMNMTEHEDNCDYDLDDIYIKVKSD